MKCKLTCIIFLLFLFLTPSTYGFQEESDAPFFRTQTNLVLTRFHVIKDQYYVETLRPEDIKLQQDRKQQGIAVFEGPETDQRTIPVEIVILLDVSLSVTRRALIDADLLERTIVANLDNHASISIYGFARDLRQFCPPTREKAVLEQALGDALAYAHKATNLYESIRKTCQLASEANRNVLRVMVVFSDGFETQKVDPKEAIKAAEEYDIKLYPVVLGHALSARGRNANAKKKVNESGEGVYEVKSPKPTGGGRSTQQMNPKGTAPGGYNRPRNTSGRMPSVSRTGANPPSQNRNYKREMQMKNFAEIGEETGGRSFDPPNLDENVMETILRLVVYDVRSEYVAGYYADANLKRGKHKVKVSLLKKSAGKLKGGEKEFVY